MKALRTIFALAALALVGSALALVQPQGYAGKSLLRAANSVSFRGSSEGSPAAWTPASIAGLQLWLDANQITGLNDGDAVATWNDLSGNSRDNTQATVSKRPIWKTTYVQFDGVDDFMTGALPNISQPFTVAFRVRQLNDGFVFSSPGTTYLPFLRSFYYAGANLVGSAFNTTDYHTVLFEANGGTSIARVDGVVNVSGNAGSTGIVSGAAACELGAWTGGTGFLCQMNLKSLVIYNRALTAGEISALETYLDALP